MPVSHFIPRLPSQPRQPRQRAVSERSAPTPRAPFQLSAGNTRSGSSLFNHPSVFGRGVTRTVQTGASLNPRFSQKFELELESQREQLRQQKMRGRLFESFFGGGAGGGGGGFGFSGGLSEGHQGLLDTVLGDLNKVGEAQRSNIDASFDEALNNQLAMFADRGLASSNLAGNAFTGVEREKQGALLDLEDTLLQRRAGATQQIGLAGLSQQQDMLMQLLSMLGG